MIIGVPKETWRDERRVALTPAGVNALRRAGHHIVVQAEAGEASGFGARDFADAGGEIKYSVEEVFGRADLVVKVMPPGAAECQWLREDSLLFSFVQMGTASAEVLSALQERQSTAVGLELIEDDDNDLPVLVAMSEIAGMLLPQIAGRYLQSHEGGRGVLLGGVAGIPASNVVILGAGTLGSTAARSFLGAGAHVIVLDADIRRLRRLEALPFKMISTAMATPYNIDRYIQFADVLVGAVFIHGKKTPHLVSESQVKTMRERGLILDVSIDQGGCIATSRPTTHSDPVFVRDNIIHYCVPNIPASVARTASHALNNVVLPYVSAVADSGFAAFRDDLSLRRGVYLYRGKCTLPEMARLFQRQAFRVDELIGSSAG